MATQQGHVVHCKHERQQVGRHVNQPHGRRANGSGKIRTKTQGVQDINNTYYLLFNCSLLLSRCVLINGKRALRSNLFPYSTCRRCLLTRRRFSLFAKTFLFPPSRRVAFWSEVPTRGTPNPTLFLGLPPTYIPYIAHP